MSVTAREAFILLAHAVEPGDVHAGRTVARIGPVAAVDMLRRGDSGLRHGDSIRARLQAVDASSAEARAASVGARILTRGDHEWPSQLDDLAELTPFALWVMGAGSLRMLALRSVAIVGARACTSYGEELARAWGAELASEHWTVFSGGAFGIDAAAHRGVLAVSGVTVCVLAGGVDMPYPRAHDALIARIADEGLVISESPPGESVRRQRFLSRNRVIAAVTRATVVIEAATRSGTIATARAATSMNRPVLAVPGPVTSAASAGCHRMIRDGEALLVESAADVMELLDLGRPRSDDVMRAGRSSALDLLTAVERRVLDAMPSRVVTDAQAIAVAAGVPPSEAWAALGALEAGGWVTQRAEGWVVARLTRSAGSR